MNQAVCLKRLLLTGALLATTVAATAAGPVTAQDATAPAEICRPLSSAAQDQGEATRSPEVEAACATSAAIIESALRSRGGTPSASPPADATSDMASAVATEPSGELATRLPPADLPSTNEQGYSYALEASLTADLTTVRADAPVYRLDTDPVTMNGVAVLAERLGLTGEVEDRGSDVYVVSGNGDLYVTSTLVQYIAPPSSSKGELPSDNDAVLAARDWLQMSGLAPPDLGEGVVAATSRGTGRVSVQFAPLEPERLLAAYPSSLVTVGPDGMVLEARLQWPVIEQYDLYRLRGSEAAWRDVEAGRAYVQAPLEGSEIEQGTRIEGTVVYDTIEIGYTTSGPPDGEQFLQPVYIFSGRVTPAGSNQSYPLSAYVPALVSSRTPVG